MTSVSALISIDRSSPVPLYFQVARRLEELIATGHLTPGTRLENEVALADQLGLSRPTMRQAIQYLVDKGLLVRKRGVGTQVVHARVRRTVELTSLYEDLDRTHQQPRTDVLSFGPVAAPDEVAVALALPSGTAVLAVERLRYAQGEPLALMRNYLPAGLLRATADELRERGLYQLMRAAGVNLRLAEQTIGARRATAAEAKALGEPRGAPLLTMARTAYDDAGRAVEFGQHAYRASLYSFELTLVAR
ncbi:GntR family transcriptional regulator [Phytohabitans sp. ZYX-F-186]|uniref:GntR family transcriptional regulator n=1 Tax=Phytohabitans maris TaxID=3071409 RepID=A0ABU0ZTP3_9ACTN|nr:GntR family transcriptional regulator [Phytohabitans sp. ZYX-F-186]MDQ7909669.1 GntR family transcriptional regulator [Phytohabitans sp. ZYX-F-186]